MRVRAFVLGLSLLATCLSGCIAEKDQVKREPELELSALPLANPKDNILTRAVSTRLIEEKVWLVSESDFRAAVERTPDENRTSSAESFRSAIALASRAGDLWTSGVVSKLYSEPAEIEGDLFFVARDASSTDDGQVLAANYYVATLPLKLSVSWYGKASYFTILPSAYGGTGSCCDRQTCEQEPPSVGNPQPSPDCNLMPWGNGNGLMCGDTFVTETSANNPALNRQAAGLNPVFLVTFDKGFKSTLSCFAPPNPGCTNTTPVCDGPETGILTPPGGWWNASYPVGSGACSGTSFERPVGGRNVPRECLYAGESAISNGSGLPLEYGAANIAVGQAMGRPQCDGQCPDCASSGATSPNGLPRQCQMMTPIPGSGVCETQTAAISQAQNLFIQGLVIAGVCSSGCCSTDCSCGPMQQNGNQLCQSCGPAGCGFFVKPSPNSPIANKDNSDPNKPKPTAPSTGAAGDPCNGNTNCIDLQTTEGDVPLVVYAPASTSRTPVAAPPPSPGQAPTSPPNPPSSSPSPANPGGEPGPAKSTENEPAKGADPVSLYDGSFVLTQTDFSFESVSAPLSFTRKYSSNSNLRSALGSNWTHNWDMRVVPLHQGNIPDWVDPYCAGSPNEITCVQLKAGENDRIFYKDIASGLFMPQAGVMSTLIQLPASRGWRLRGPDGHVSTFDPDGYLSEDRDRFGNGFNIEYEMTPAGELYQALCPALPYEYQINAGTWGVASKPGGLTSDHAICSLLAGLTGISKMPQWRANTTSQSYSTIYFPVPNNNPQLLAAKAAIDRLQVPGYGTASHSGRHAKRPLTVTDDLGRALHFHYYGASSADKEGLLRSVSASAGNLPLGAIDFTYQRAANLPAWDNEFFLTSASRNDPQTGSTAIVATPSRTQEYVYSWGLSVKQVLSTKTLDLIRTRFREYFSSFLNCGFHRLNSCGNVLNGGFLSAEIDVLLETEVTRYLSDVADNIILVRRSGVVESETRYNIDPFDRNFDKAVAQRWGSSAAVSKADPTQHVWTTALPLSVLEYAESGPTGSNNTVSPSGTTTFDDHTSSFLPPEIAQRYPLEDVTYAAASSAQSKGTLLPPETDLSVAVVGKLQALVEGELRPLQGNGQTVPMCKPSQLPNYRSRLPGYRPEFDYFDAELPAVLNQDTPTPGLDLNSSLKRSRLSCQQLSVAQTYDVRHNDLAVSWKKNANSTSGLDYTVERLVGRRQYTTANANRICAWSRETDRDGDVHLYGLNFQGQILVDAIQMADRSWRYAETLYNADGNVLSQRGTKASGSNWRVTDGDTRYRYEEYFVPQGSYTASIPWYWARRGNIMAIYERPKLAATANGVSEEIEGSPGNFENTKGRYSIFQYEPLFNQVSRIDSGSIEPNGNFRTNWLTRILFDYQELDTPQITDLLLELQSWGYQFQMNATNGTFSFQDILRNQLPRTFNHGDVNGDGELGTWAPAGQDNLRGRGLPIRVTTESASGQVERSYYRWAPSGKPYFIQSADGTVTSLKFYPLDKMSGAVANPNDITLHGREHGLLATISQLPRTEWPTNAGPNRAPCPNLPGPYQWLLPATCGPDVAAQLSALGLARDAVQAIVTRPESVKSIDYSPIGQPSSIADSSKRRRVFTRDLDGRTLRDELYDGASLHNVTVTKYDTLMFPQRVDLQDPRGKTIQRTLRQFNEEGQVNWECSEAAKNGCLPMGTDRPVSGSSNRYWYTAEGYLQQSQDPEGLITQYRYDARKWKISANRFNPSTSDPLRPENWQYDDDGRVVSHSIGSGSSSVSQTLAYDGYGRLSEYRDERALRHIYRYSARDVLTTSIVLSANSSLQWTTHYGYDDFARPLRRLDNGTVSIDLRRMEGGRPYARRAEGSSWLYTTFDAEGNAAFSEDGSGNQSVATTQPSLRERSFSRIRRGPGNTLTTSTLEKANVQGLPLVLTEIGGALSRASIFKYNSAGDSISKMSPDKSFTEASYDWLGRVTEIREQRSLQSPAFDISRYSYNRRGQLVSVRDPSGQVTTQTYNGFGQPKTRNTGGTPPVVESWAYDSLGRLASENHGPAHLQYEYDPVRGLLSRVFNENVNLKIFSYDELGRVNRSTHFNAEVSTLGVNPIDRQVTTEITYDSLGRVAGESTRIGNRPQRALSSTYAISPLSGYWQRSINRPDGSSSLEELDGDGRLRKIRRPTGRDTEYSYLDDLPLEVTSQKIASPLRLKIAYDDLGQSLSRVYSAVDLDASGNPLVAAQGNAYCPGGWNSSCARPVLKTEVARDVMGRIASFSRSTARPNTLELSQWRGYVYDAMGRLTVARESDKLPQTALPTHQVAGQQIEAAGNLIAATRWLYKRDTTVGSLVSIDRTDAIEPPRFTSPPRGPAHQIQSYTPGSAPSRAVSHDSAGRIITDGAQSYDYDSFSSLITVRSANGGWNETYLYDAQGRLVARINSTGSGEQLVWDRRQIIAAYDWTNSNHRWKTVWGIGIDNLISIQDGANEYLALRDPKSNIVGYFDANTNSLLTESDYTPEGRVSSIDYLNSTKCVEKNALRCPNMAGLPFGFHGAYRSETTGLLYFRYRWYSPELAQWLSQDPRGSIDSFDLYSFNAFDPINFRDPYGLSTSSLADRQIPPGNKPELPAANPNITTAVPKSGERSRISPAAKPKPALKKNELSLPTKPAIKPVPNSPSLSPKPELPSVPAAPQPPSAGDNNDFLAKIKQSVDEAKKTIAETGEKTKQFFKDQSELIIGYWTPTSKPLSPSQKTQVQDAIDKIKKQGEINKAKDLQEMLDDDDILYDPGLSEDQNAFLDPISRKIKIRNFAPNQGLDGTLIHEKGHKDAPLTSEDLDTADLADLVELNYDRAVIDPGTLIKLRSLLPRSEGYQKEWRYLRKREGLSDPVFGP